MHRVGRPDGRLTEHHHSCTVVHLIVSLHALGKAEILTPLARITPAQGRSFAASLYLFLERAKPVARTLLAELLWPGIADESRQHRLRQVLVELRHAGVPLDTNRETVALAGNGHSSDVDVLLTNGAGDIDVGRMLQFLPGYAPTFSREYSDWLDSKRREFAANASRLLIGDIRRARGRGDWLRIERCAAMCLEIDPFNEEAVLAGAEASAMRGAKREAVSMLDRYVADLGPASGDLKLPASLMRKRIAERVPEATMAGRTEGIFVGRESDMQVLTTLLDDARGSEGRCCLLFGDPGIGKSRLAAELARFGELQGVQVRRVACRRGDAQRPLSVFVEAVPQLLEMRGALGCSPDTISDLRRLTQFDSGREAKQAMEIDPQSMFELVRLAIFDLIDAVSEEQCLMLIVEDVHWMDPASARILGQLADWSAKKRVFLLFTSRLRENPLLEACTRAGLVAHHVRPLSSEVATVLVSEMFEATNEKRDEEFLEWCRKVGDGNPFFLHELVKQWLETKQRHAIPPSLMTVIRERFSRLSSEGTQLLQACSILGEQSTLPRVEKMLQQEPYMLLGALSELSKASMLSPERKVTAASGDFHLRPRHDMVATVAMGELDPHGAAFLHRRAAEMLESELGGDVQDTGLLWACAQHWQRAGETDRSYTLARKCAEHLLEVGLPGDAADILRKLFPYCRTAVEEVEVMNIALLALQSAHRWAEVADLCDEIRTKIASDHSHDLYELTKLNSLWRIGLDPAHALQKVLECIESAVAPADHRVAAACLAMKLASDQCDVAVMDRIFSAVHHLLTEESVDPLTAAELEVVFHAARGNLERVLDCSRRLTATARLTGNPLLISRHFANSATALRLIGEIGEARCLVEEAIEFALANRRFLRAKHVSLQLIRLNLLEHDLPAARKTLNRLAGYRFPIDDRIALTELGYLESRVLLGENRLDEAADIVRALLLDTTKFAQHFRGPVLAVAVRLYVSKPSESLNIEKLLSELEQLHLRDRDAGWNDFEAGAIYVGLASIGKEKRGRKLIEDYVTVHRRDTSKLPDELASIAAALQDQNHRRPANR